MRRTLPTARALILMSVFAPALGGCPSAGSGRNVSLSRTHFLLGADYVKKKMPVAAKRELLQAIKLDPDNSEAHELLGVLFFMEGVSKAALVERVQCLKGEAAEEQRQEANVEFRRAEKRITSAIDIDARSQKINSEALNYLANISLHFKRYDDAIRQAKKALSNIGYAARHLALGTLGWAYYQKGNLALAGKELRQSVFHQPKFCVGRYRLAKVYYDQKRYDQAIEELKRVTADAACPIQEAYHLFGLALMKAKQPEQARGQFDLCVKKNPKSCLSEECRRYAKLI